MPNAVPLIAVVGPTATGKTALAIDIARKIGGEIICADSRTLYAGLDIGTAKPTPEERRLVPHHMLDVIKPTERLSAGEFKRQAQQLIAEIGARGHVPLLVGGSGLYVDSVLYDYQFPPAADPVQRAELERLPLATLVQRLQTLDPEAASSVDLQNPRRVIRAIETAGVGKSRASRLRDRTLVLGLMVNKEVARQRIEQRVKKMLEEGFIDEVKRVGKRYGWDSEAMAVIGYRAFREVAQGQEAVIVGQAKFVAGDMALYKKQVTWFKRNPDIHLLQDPAEAWPLVDRFLVV